MYNKYPYTDFSELNLDWFLEQFKLLVEEWKSTEEKWAEMQQNFQTLESTVQTFTNFVENYFENLDVQQEINNKLDAMALDGTLSDLLAPFVTSELPGVVTTQLPSEVTSQLPGVVTTQLPGVVADQIDAAVAPEVPGAVTTWLNANVDPVGSAVTIDSSLSIAGSAADAKIVGDLITEDQLSIGNELFSFSAASIYTNTIKRKLNDNDGLYSVNVDYKVQVFNVTPGQVFKVVSDDKFQFQSDNVVATSGTTSRVGTTFGVGTYLVTVPSGATNLMVSTLMVGSTASVSLATNKIEGDIDRINWMKVRANALTAASSHISMRSATAPVAYYVGANRTYTTINDALTAWAADNKPDAIVYIDNGEYNEVVYVEDSNISFIGESREGVVLRTTDGGYNYSPFRIHHGNVTVANMTVIADHSDDPDMVLDSNTLYAYAFHIDGGNVGGIVHVKNCTAISYQAPAFGMGTIPGATIIIEDCDAYCFTPAYATKTVNNDCILCHLADPNIYTSPDPEALEIINVNCYAKENPQNLLIKSSGSPKSLGLTVINTIFVNGVSTGFAAGLASATLNSLSRGNNYDALNT